MRICRVLRVKQMLGVWPALIAKLVWRIPVVSTYGYDYAHFAKKEGLWWLVPLIRIIEWCGLRFSDQIIVTLPSGRPRTNLIPNGVDIDLFKPGKRSPGKELKILAVGRLVHQKNQLNLLRAIAKLSCPVELTLVGRGPLKTKIFELAKKFKVKLQYIESASHLDLAKIYQAADIFVVASTAETQCLSMMNAMLSELPVIGVRAGALPEYINDSNGFIVEPGDYHAFTEKILYLIKNPDQAIQLGRQGREYAKQFSSPNIAKEWLLIYESVINKRKII